MSPINFPHDFGNLAPGFFRITFFQESSYYSKFKSEETGFKVYIGIKSIIWKTYSVFTLNRKMVI